MQYMNDTIILSQSDKEPIRLLLRIRLVGFNDYMNYPLREENHEDRS